MTGRWPRSRAILAGCVMLSLVAGGSSCQGKGEPWRRYRPGDGTISLELPGKPVETASQSIGLGAITEVTVVQLDRGARGMLQVAHYALIAGATDQPHELLARLDCLHPFTGSNFVAGEPIARDVAGHPGLAITGVAPRSPTLPRGGWEEDRCAVIGGRMFHLTAIGPDDDVTRREGARFLDSFAVSTGK